MRLTRKQALLVLAAGTALAAGLRSGAFAQEGHTVTTRRAGPGAMRLDGGPATQACVDAATRMHAAMDIPYTGDADVDFVRGMIAHHHGAIDMATVVIAYGPDPDIRTARGGDRRGAGEGDRRHAGMARGARRLTGGRARGASSPRSAGGPPGRCRTGGGRTVRDAAVAATGSAQVRALFSLLVFRLLAGNDCSPGFKAV